jgi:hypothetical protein
MGRSPRDLSWEIMWWANRPKDSEDPPRPPPSLFEAVLVGTAFAAFGVNFAVRSGSPASLLLVLFAFVWVADALPIRRYRGRIRNGDRARHRCPTGLAGAPARIS